jgi:hypothetical protein
MTDSDVEDSAPRAEVPALPKKKQPGLFGSSGIELHEDELASPATTKFLRHLNSKQEADIDKLKSFEGQFYDKRQECEILKEKKASVERELRQRKELENVQKVMIALGSILLGSLKLIADSNWYIVSTVAVVGVVLVVSGLFPFLQVWSKK